ncbi:hypothetical protein CC78DRAFT_536440 [Lojkania enalia]|uniref:Uncharacterized protein n=1 Tax=Lojkania enalia TaxID=147567 RepID=A0A9P4K0H2_9PLEO|nr:hypothetical protein CC78DRAFT_536440 [Didymosphaeria enalia]
MEAFSFALSAQPYSPASPRHTFDNSSYDPWRDSYCSQRLMPPELVNTNLEAYLLFNGDDLVPQQYVGLMHYTQAFVSALAQLARLPGGFAPATILLVDFTVTVLREQIQNFFLRLLNSQRIQIYCILDEALLRICLDEWERDDDVSGPLQPWGEAICPLAHDISSAVDMIPKWAEAESAWLARLWDIKPETLAGDGSWIHQWYFARTRKFLEESMKVYSIRTRVNKCVDGRLPAELVDTIVGDVLRYYDVPTGGLRRKHLPAGKGKHS